MLNRPPFLADALIWDNHACMPLSYKSNDFSQYLEKLRAAGTSLVSLNVSFDLKDWSHGFKMLARFRSDIRANADKCMLIETTADIEAAKASGKIGIFFDIEGGCAVDDMPELVEPYYALGVRWMLIAYNQTNRLGGGCQNPDPGLSDFGCRVIDEMERVGMIVDISHTGYRTAREVLEYASKPVNISHSNPRTIWDHERNVTDDLIRACAATGGVINVTGIGIFLGNNDNSTETFIRHVDYVASIAGPEHVGMGLDFVFDSRELDEFIALNPDMFPPDKGYGQGLRMIEPERVAEIATGLIEIGWSENHVLGFLGQNNLRVADAVWK
nr:membrane dipeptidase [Hyphomonas sp. Mor2]